MSDPRIFFDQRPLSAHERQQRLYKRLVPIEFYHRCVIDAEHAGEGESMAEALRRAAASWEREVNAGRSS